MTSRAETNATQVKDDETPPLPSIKGHPPEHYMSLITFISTLGIFGGSVTFAALFTIQCNDHVVPKVVGFASTLFLGSVLACVPIMVALHTEQDRSVEWHLHPQNAQATNLGPNAVLEPKLSLIRTQFIIVTILILGAFICMFIAILLFGYGAPAILGFVIIFLNIVWSVVAYRRDIIESKALIWCLQALTLAIIAVIAIIFGVRGITDIDWENRCGMRLND